MVVKSDTLLAAPPLRHGDRMDADEFERRYEQTPQHIKAELIDGIVHTASPVSYGNHGRQDADFGGMFWFYTTCTRGTSSGDNSTVKLDRRNQPQPDTFLMIDPDRGGRSRVDEYGYIHGTPELVAEVAASSISIDMGVKLELYRDSGAPEYLVRRVDDEAIDLFVLTDGNYEAVLPDIDGILRSLVFPGLWFNVPALLRGDREAVFITLKQGIDSPEHAAFVQRLNAKTT